MADSEALPKEDNIALFVHQKTGHKNVLISISAVFEGKATSIFTTRSH